MEAYLAKSVRKMLGSRIVRSPPTPAPYAHAAVQKRSGELPNDTRLMALRFNVGPAEGAGCASQTLTTLKEQRRQL